MHMEPAVASPTHTLLSAWLLWGIACKRTTSHLSLWKQAEEAVYDEAREP